jgi:hypothetical protein
MAAGNRPEAWPPISYFFIFIFVSSSHLPCSQSLPKRVATRAQLDHTKGIASKSTTGEDEVRGKEPRACPN